MNKYSISVVENVEASDNNRRLNFEFKNHDDLFLIVEKIKAISPFDNEEEDIQFSVGLKLFSSIIMKHKEEELFKDLLPAFIEFMKKLKTRK